MLDEVEAAWRAAARRRSRVHLACLPMADIEENAAIVNALQRHATVVVQKSIPEGFGLTVAEAMWKARPVVASAVGGIQDQIEDGVTGLLLDDPTDLDASASGCCVAATTGSGRTIGAGPASSAAPLPRQPACAPVHRAVRGTHRARARSADLAR